MGTTDQMSNHLLEDIRVLSDLEPYLEIPDSETPLDPNFHPPIIKLTKDH